MRTPYLCILGIGILLFQGCSDQPKQEVKKDKTMQVTDYTQIDFDTNSGGTANLENFKGSVLLIVNTASECGFTKQYAGLEQLHRDKGGEGLIVIAFPSNNFGGQEPGTNDEILEFCQSKFDVTFPLMAKVNVIGADKHSLFKYLTEGSSFPGEIKWNFSKFLLDREGSLVARFDPKVKPDDPELTGKIDELLASGGSI